MPSPDHAERIRRILGKLADVRERNIETFGSNKHRFVLGPPASEAEIAAFEDTEGVRLPEDFRTFLRDAGGSGAGPYYGLLPVSDFGDICLDAPSGWAGKPALFSPNMPRTQEAYDAAVAGVDEPFQGTIAIGEQGCAFYTALVVTGPHAGRVIYVNVDGGVPIFVENPDFLSWYERWLDELLDGNRHHWFGTDMPGDERSLAQAARGTRRRDALVAMHRLPTISDETAALAALRIRDDDAAVRAAALGVVAKFAIAAAEPHVRRAVDDADGAVRLAAMLALAAIGAPWFEEGRRLMRDPAADVATRAVREMTRASAVSEDELLTLLEEAQKDVVWAVVAALDPLRSPHGVAALLPRARATEDNQVLLCLLSGAAVATPEQRDAILALLLDRLAATTTAATPVVYGLGPLVKTHPRALDALLEATRHVNAFVRYDAAGVLGNVAGPEAIPALEALSADPTMPREDSVSTVWSVGHNARHAIEKIRERG